MIILQDVISRESETEHGKNIKEIISKIYFQFLSTDKLHRKDK